MEKDPTNTPSSIDHEEISILLRTLRIEATHEAYFEERFIYDFREKLVSEAACRPARVLLWEHLLQVLNNVGGRRIAWSLSSFGIGALCMGVFLSQYTGTGKRTLAVQTADYGRDTSSMRPGSSQAIVCTSVRRAKQKSRVGRLATSLVAGTYSYFSGMDDDDTTSQIFSSSPAEDTEPGFSMQGLSPSFAR